ncbi:MAG: peptide-N-glycosidase F-related protein [Salibacteraceae bacterium]|nr:peptide-N-glycosidase F-related protein [Salibacteraceae bacterium]
MKKLLLSFTALFCSLTFLKAAEGDTTSIQSHQATHWSWFGNYYDTVQFPQTGTYRKIIMYYTLGCPSIGCSEWDYTTKIEVSDPLTDSTNRWVELTKIITPYAGDKNSGWTHTWAFDVTDFAPLLKGERQILASYSGYQDGFTITVNFDFIEGTPPREVLAVNTLYDGIFKYGFANDPIDNYLQPTPIAINANAESAKFRLVASGHSFGGAENCAEFCPKWYKLKIDGSQVVQEDVWRDDCGSNVLEAQTGTWVYDRAGWCPGDVAVPYETDITSFIDAGQSNTFDVDWENYNYTGGAGFDPQYGIEALVFQYGAWNFENDASLDKVIKPSMDDRNMRVNPICNNPEVEVSNTGSKIISRMKIRYWVEGSVDYFDHSWSGVLLPGENTRVELPSHGKWLFGGKTENVFYAQILEVNQTTDEYASNNLISAKFEDPIMFPERIVVAFNNNNVTNETRYYIYNDKGETVYSRTTSTASTNYTDTIDLDTGCYRFAVTDAGCDGLRFFANSAGNGKIWLHNAEPANYFPPLYQFEDEFGCETEFNFTVGYENGEEAEGYPAGMMETTKQQNLWVYPNPSKGDITIAVRDFVEPGTLDIYNTSGQKVRSVQIVGMNSTQISGLAAGNYIAKFVGESTFQTASFVIVK